MELVCIQEFGHHKVDDVVEVPDGAEFSPLYFREKEEPKEEKDENPSRRSRRPANASPEATGEDVGSSSTPVVSPPADDDAGSDELEKNEG